MRSIIWIAALTLPVAACVTARDADVICQGIEGDIRALAALEAQMTDPVAVAADRLIVRLDAGCGR